MTTSDTPRTDAEADTPNNFDVDNHRAARLGKPTIDLVVPADFARQLERQLATAQRELEEARRDSVRLDYALAECAKVNATARGNFYLPEARGGIDAARKEASKP